MCRTVRGTENLFSTGFFRGSEILKPILVSFSGIDGAGKSTQIEKLRSYLFQAGIPVRDLTFWDNVAMFHGVRSAFSRVVLQSDGSVGTPDRPANRNDKNAQFWPLLVGRAALYVFDVMNLRRVVARAKLQDGGVVIFDRYIYDQLAAMPMDSWLARTYAKFLLKLAPQPDLSYVLDAIPEEARARKPEYPVDFMHRQRKSYLRLREMAGLQIIPAGAPDGVHAAVIERFQKCVLAPSLQSYTSPVTA
jgi:thymidylate kinase